MRELLRASFVMLAVSALALANPPINDDGTYSGGAVMSEDETTITPPSGPIELDGGLILHVSFRNPGTGNLNMVAVADETGSVLSTYSQVNGGVTGVWGYRDGDSIGDQVYFGWEGGIARHDADGANGTIVVPGPPAGGGGLWRALGYDPDGDGGNGSWWTCSFTGPLIELKLDGTFIRSFPNPGAGTMNGWSLYGIYVDRNTKNIWGHSQVNSTSGQPAEVIEINKAAGVLTGVRWLSGVGTTGPIQGGLSGDPNTGTLFGLVQATPDHIYSADTAGNYVPPITPNPLPIELQTGQTGNLGIAVVGGGGGQECPAKPKVKAKYKGSDVSAKASGLTPGDGYDLVLVDKDGNDVGTESITADANGKAKAKFKNVNCAGAPHTVELRISSNVCGKGGVKKVCS